MTFSLEKAALCCPESQKYPVKQTLQELSSFFSGNGHRPSSEMWDALEDLADTMNSIIEGRAEQKYYLSSLDPGVGKTQTLSKFVNTLLSKRSDYKDIGVIIFVNSLSEVKRRVKELDIPKNSLCVFTSDETLNRKGKVHFNEAQVMITTQQMLESRSKSKSFVEIKEFHYQGQPRILRLWDESFLPGKAITISVNDLGLLYAPLSYVSQELSAVFKQMVPAIEAVGQRGIFTIPDFSEVYEGTLSDVLSAMESHKNMPEKSLRAKQQELITVMWTLSGRTINVRKDGMYGHTLITYENTFPEDLAPMVILDASGRCRPLYTDIEKERKSLVRLKTATKRYDRLKINVWSTASGKNIWQNKNRHNLIQGIAKTIRSKPEEEWLVVIPKAGNRIPKLEQEIRESLGTYSGKVHFITWGYHMSVNKYANVRNVILASTLNYRVSTYEANKRLAANRRAEDGEVTDAEISDVVLGEHRHHILQALCRGAVRKCEGDRCHPMNAYIIAPASSGIKDELPLLFPSCLLEEWSPNPRKLKGKVKDAVEYLKRWKESLKNLRTKPNLVSERDFFVSFKEVQKAIRVAPADFQKSIRQHRDFIEAVAALGIEEYGQNVRMTGFRDIYRTRFRFLDLELAEEGRPIKEIEGGYFYV